MARSRPAPGSQAWKSSKERLAPKSQAPESAKFYLGLRRLPLESAKFYSRLWPPRPGLSQDSQTASVPNSGVRRNAPHRWCAPLRYPRSRNRHQGATSYPVFCPVKRCLSPSTFRNGADKGRPAGLAPAGSTLGFREADPATSSILCRGPLCRSGSISGLARSTPRQPSPGPHECCAPHIPRHPQGKVGV